MILVVILNDENVEDVMIIPVRINKYYVPELLSGKEADILTKKYQKLCKHPVLKQGAESSEFVSFYRKKYNQQVRWRLIENKIQNRLFFLRHLHKYPNGIAWQSLTGFVAGRMGKLNENGKC
ncbi:hypothetical protein ABF87_14730 [Nitrosomonas sp. JL21]|nr:hypothetical protein [Nitrosomonas sp. JL21]